MTESPYEPPALLGDEPNEEEGLRRRPWVAGLLSLLVPGAGQLYGGRYRLGIALFLLVVGSWWLLRSGFLARTMWHLLAVLAILLLVQLAAAIEAAVTAARRRTIPHRPFHRPLVFVPVVLAMAAVPALLPDLPAPERPVQVPTGAMRPTIREDELVRVDYRHYRRHPPRRGDLAVFPSPQDGKTLLKRIVGLPGERVEMRGGRAVIDGDAELDRWAHVERALPELGFAVTVPAGELFVLGDNRHNSRDSRHFGFVPEETLLGRAESIYYSVDLERIGQPLVEGEP
jgi:signal peptidase I